MSQTDKMRQLVDTIEKADRARIRKIVLEHKMKGTTLTKEQYCRFVKLAVEWYDLSLAYVIHEVRPKLDATMVAQLLWTIIEDNDTTIASMLVTAGADVNQPQADDSLGLSFLHVLAKSSDPKKYELALLMMNHGALTMAEDAYKFTVLEYAIMSENLALARELLARGALTDEHVLYLACCSCKSVESMLLIVNDNRAKNPAIQSRIVADTFKLLCEFDVDEDKIISMMEALLDIEVPPAGVTIEAVLYDKIDVVKLLLKRTDIDNPTKMIFLHCAASLPSSSMARMVIEWGADIEYSLYLELEHFNRGIRPLHVACQYGSQENIQLLLDLGANVNATDVYGNTPFSFLIHDQLSKSCRLFIKHFALLNSKSDTVNRQDLQCVASYPILQQFYDKCLRELHEMEKLRFFNGISYLAIFTKNLKNLSMLMRRPQFLENCKTNLDLFSVYRDDLNRRLREAEKRNDLLTPNVDALYDVLNAILPHVPIENVIKHLYCSDI